MSEMIDPFMRGFGYSPVDLPLADVEWLTDRRVEAKNAYERLGLPTIREEAWKYTNLKSLRAVDFQLGTKEFDIALAALPAQIRKIDAYNIVFVNGIFDEALSDMADLPEGVRLGNLASAITNAPEHFKDLMVKQVPFENDALAALNAAYLADGLYLEVDRAVTLEKPVHLISLTSTAEEALNYHPHHWIRIGDGAQAVLLETHYGFGSDVGSFSNTVCDIELGKDCHFGHYKLQKESDSGNAASITAVTADKSAVYDNFSLQLGGNIIRNDIRCAINGERAEIRLNGAYHADGKRHHDTTTYVEHNVPNASCREVYKGVLDDQGRGVFQGKIKVNRGADGTDGHQLHKALLLSDKAEVDAKPELEIYADDVKCAHGSTSGALDDMQLFYLESRGIDEKRARAMLVQAFLHDAVDEIQNKMIADLFHEELGKKLGEDT